MYKPAHITYIRYKLFLLGWYQVYGSQILTSNDDPHTEGLRSEWGGGGGYI